MTDLEQLALRCEGASENKARPSRHGAILGAALAKMADAGRKADPTIPDACATCAFTAGSMPNQMAPTTLVAFNCATGIDPSPFGCHHGMKDGLPTRLCAGYVAARCAPFETLKALAGEVCRDLDGMEGPDTVREQFDAELAKIDPDGTMDDYQLARARARQARQPQEGGDIPQQGDVE
jgi:hypothetical protein